MKTFAYLFISGLFVFGCSHLGFAPEEGVSSIFLKLPMAKNKGIQELEKTGKLSFEALMANTEEKNSPQTPGVRMSMTCPLTLQVEVQGDNAGFKKALSKGVAPFAKLEKETKKIAGKKRTSKGWLELSSGFVRKQGDKFLPLESGKVSELVGEFSVFAPSAAQPKELYTLFLSPNGVGFQLPLSPKDAQNVKIVLKMAEAPEEISKNILCDKIVRNGFKLKP